MLNAAILASIFGILNKSQSEVVANIGKEEALSELKERFRKEFLVHFIKTYTEEMQYNIAEYVRKMEEMSAEAEIPLRDKQSLDFKFSKMMYNFMEIFERKVKDSPVIAALERKYARNPKIFTGAPAQKSPVLAWVNKEISPPASFQPTFLIQDDIDMIAREVLKIYDSIDLEHL